MNIRQRNQFSKIKRFVRLIAVIVLAIAAVTVLMLGLQAQQQALANGHLIGLVPTEHGVVEDDIFNWLAYEGLLRAESELGVTGTVYTPTNSEDYGAKLDQCAMDGNELCISVSFSMGDATLNAANTYTETEFAIVDWDYENYPDNLRGLGFRSKEAGYLAGVLAGHMTASNTIGTVGGWEIPGVVVFTEGYRNGAQCANPAANVLIEYTWDWFDPQIGAQAAQEMIAQGADAIFGVGGRMGNGAVITATQSGVWGIGVDVDIYTTVFENGALDGSDKLLTSVVKKIDNAVFATISDVISGTLSAGTTWYGLAEDGVGLAPFHEADSSVSESVKDTLDATAQGIISGTIDVNYGCRPEVYLPLLVQ